jgi:prefoldin alpha subunit
MTSSKKEIILAFEYVEDQINQVSKQLDSFDTQFIKVSDAILALQTLGTDVSALVPISDGIYARSTLHDINTVIVDVGNNIAVEKTKEEALVMLQEQLSLVKEYQEKLTKRLTQLSTEADTLQSQLRSLDQEAKI